MTRSPFTPSRSTAPSPAGRGQTLHDFTLGISIFLLITSFALGVFPSLLGSFGAGVTEADQIQSHRVAQQLVANHSVEGDVGHLKADNVTAVIESSQSELHDRFQLRTTEAVNVSLQSVPTGTIVHIGGTRMAVGDTTDSETAASTRVVTLDNGDCTEGCYLTVRIW